MDIDLTHPEILTIEQLQKFVRDDRINDRYELIQLFYKYVAPLPQRKFRPNRLGSTLTDSQQQFRREKRAVSDDAEETKKSHKSIVRPPANGLSAETESEKHESDRGIYTITMQKSTTKNTAPIKLKRPSSTTITDGAHDGNKRTKSDT